MLIQFFFSFLGGEYPILGWIILLALCLLLSEAFVNIRGPSVICWLVDLKLIIWI